MESQPQNPEFRINPENFDPCNSAHCVILYPTMYHEIIVDAAQLASNEKLSTSFTLYYCIQPKKCTVHVTFQSSIPYFEIIVEADQLALNENFYTTSFTLYYCIQPRNALYT